MFVVCNIDGNPVAQVEDIEIAKRTCRDLAIEASATGDYTNGYYIDGMDDFDGYRAADFPTDKEI